MKVAAGVIAAIGLLLVGIAVGRIATDDSGSSKAAGKPQVLGQVFAKNPDTSTSTTVATLAPVTPGTQAPTTPTTAKAANTQTVTLTPTQTQTTSPPATTTVVVTNTACGSGTASAKVSSQTFPRSETANTDYETDIAVAVTNGVDKAIQLDSLTVHLLYTDGGTQDVVFNDATGTVIQPGVTNNYGVKLNTGKRQVENAENGGVTLKSFSFHTAGHPECAGHNA
jgi:hypothetical protein